MIASRIEGGRLVSGASMGGASEILEGAFCPNAATAAKIRTAKVLNFICVPLLH